MQAYTNEWSDWSANPLKDKAIEYYEMQDLVKKMIKKQFSHYKQPDSKTCELTRQKKSAKRSFFKRK